jgi:hypothetical protein
MVHCIGVIPNIQSESDKRCNHFLSPHFPPNGRIGKIGLVIGLAYSNCGSNRTLTTRPLRRCCIPMACWAWIALGCHCCRGTAIKHNRGTVFHILNMEHRMETKQIRSISSIGKIKDSTENSKAYDWIQDYQTE